jgi:hypothetical protein
VLAAWLGASTGATLRTALLRAAPYAALALTAAITAERIFRAHEMVIARQLSAPVDVGASFATFALHTIWPTRLAPMYPTIPAHAALFATIYAAGIVAIGATWRRLSPAARFAAVAYHAALLPVVNLVPTYFRYSDRYALLAGAVLVVPIAALAQSLGARRIALALVVVAGAELTLTVPLAHAWRDSSALWAHTTAAQPATYLAHLKRGETLRDAKDYDGAAAEYRAAVHIDPARPLGYVGLFYLEAVRAEQAGDALPGSADYWLDELSHAMGDVDRWNSLRRRVARTCHACADVMLVLSLRQWPQPDDVLLRDADRALAADAPVQAKIYLDAVKDRSAAEYRALSARAMP